VPASGPRPIVQANPEPVVAVMEPPAAAPAPMVVKRSPHPSLREQLLKPGWKYAAAGLTVLVLLMVLPLLFPAATTKGEPAPSETPRKPPSEPRPGPRKWDGVVREFLVIGPMWRNSTVAQQVEEDPKSDGVYLDRFGQEYRWRAQKGDDTGTLTIATGFAARPSVLFALVHVHAPRQGKATIISGAADASRVWVNGVEVLETTQVRIQPRTETDKVNISLNAGWNSILVRLGARGDRPFEYYLSVESADSLRPALRPES
jgi:hypothetical protein